MTTNQRTPFIVIPAADQKATCGGMSSIGSTLPRPVSRPRPGGSSSGSTSSKPKNATESAYKPFRVLGIFGF